MENQDHTHTTGLLTKDMMHKMKGQAIPLFGYHILRDYVMKDITGEHQSAILYWAGKNLAALLRPQSLEEIHEFFLEMGWGFLECTHHSPFVQRYTLESPFFNIRQIKQNKQSFALECGFITEATALIEQKHTEGEYTIEQSEQKMNVLIVIYVEERKEEKKDTSGS